MNLADLATLNWREPLWLLLALQPVLLWMAGLHRRRVRLAAYAERALQPWVIDRAGRVSRWRVVAYAAAWLLIAIGAAGPRLAREIPPAARAAGETVLAVVDLSASMGATDVAPSRLRRARLELFEFLDRARGARAGIIVYAGRPHLYVPPTDDVDALRFYVDVLDRLVLPTRGSDAAGALALARAELHGQPGQVIWITDGDLGEPDDPQRAQLAQAVDALRASGATVSILGTGTVEGAALRAPDGKWLTDGGKPVVSRMDEQALAALATAGGGRFVAARDDDSDWALAFRARRGARIADESLVVWQELQNWFLLPGLLLLFASVAPCSLRAALAPRAAALVLLPLLWPLAARSDDAGQAWRALERADNVAAAALYARLGGYAGRLGEGVSRYRMGAFEDAARQFAEAVLAARTDEQRAVALHDLGDAQFQLGDYAAAVEAFGDALRYRPDHAATEHNLRFSSTLLAEVERRAREQTAARAGSGTRTAPATPGLAVGNRSGLTLDNDNRPVARPPALPDDDPHRRFEQLVRAGLARLQVAASGPAGEGSTAWVQDLAAARARVLQIADDRSRLWQHVFEIEEGFEAPQPIPLPLPGRSPW